MLFLKKTKTGRPDRANPRFVALLALLAILLFPARFSPCNGESASKILILNSYHKEYEWTDNIVKGVKDRLRKEKIKNDLYVEYMDSKRYFNEEYLQKLQDLYRFKYGKISFDVIICSDDNAFHFLREHRNELFPGCPVVFCGLNRMEDSFRRGMENFTGLVEVFDVRPTIDLALRLFPTTEEIYVISDKTVTGRSNRKKVEDVTGVYSDQVRFEFLDSADYSLGELKSRLQLLPRNSIVIYLDFFRDRLDRYYSYPETLPEMSEICPAPMFCLVDLYLEHGPLGGKLNSGYYQGSNAAGMAVSILKGIPASEIGISYKSPNRYMFDYDQMKRFNIKITELPPDTILINPPDSLYYRYKHVIWGLIAFLAFETFIIITLLVNRVLRRRAEAALRESEEKYRLLFTEMISSFELNEIVCDENGEPVDYRFLELNPAFEKMTGVKPSDAVGKTAREILPDIDDNWIRMLGDVALQARPLHTERYSPHFDRYYEIFAYNHGKRLFAVISSDITERKKTEKKIIEAHEVYRKVIRNDRGVPYYYNISDGMYDFYGEKGGELLKIPTDELTGEKLQRIVREIVVTDPDGPMDPYQYGKEFLEGKVTRYRVDYRIETEDGEERWISNTALPVRDEKTGRTIGALGVMHDITDRKRAEEDLRASEEKYRILVESATDMIYSVDRESRILSMNTLGAESLYLKPEEIYGKKLFDLFPRDFSDRLMIDIMKVFNTGQPLLIKQHSTIIRETNRWFSTILSPGLDKEGTVKWVMGISRDITEQKRREEERRNLEAQFQHVQKLEGLGILAGGIAHDFNNLLVGILGNADMAKDHLPVGSPARRSLKEIETGAKRAADLCRQLLAYSGKGRFMIETVNLNDVVKEMSHLLEVSISKKVRLIYNLTRDIPAVEADATQMRQVVMNLITNASEAIDKRQGSITVSTGVLECKREDLADTYINEKLPEGKYVFLEVSDSGCGMDRETLERIFDPFFTTKFTGRGLGLAAVLGIVRGHHGTIKVNSEKDRGTTFQILLPSLGPTVKPHPVEDLESEEWRGSGMILFVDDEKTVRTVGQRMLEMKGFDVITAKDGSEAVRLFREHHSEIRLIILDLTMPKMDGRETYQELRGISRDVPVILSSGYSEQEIEKHFDDGEIAGFLQKPYKLDTIIREVKRVFENAIEESSDSEQ